MALNLSAGNALVKRVRVGSSPVEHPSLALWQDGQWTAENSPASQPQPQPLTLEVRLSNGPVYSIGARSDWPASYLYCMVAARENLQTHQIHLWLVGATATARTLLDPLDTRDLHGQGVADGASVLLRYSLRGGVYCETFAFTMCVTPPVNATAVSCLNAEIRIDLDMRGAILRAAAAQRELQDRARHGWSMLSGCVAAGPSLEDRLRARLDTLASLRISVTRTRRTLVRREGTQVRRWDYHATMVLVAALRRHELPSEVCRLVVDATALPPEEWESSEEEVVLSQRSATTTEPGRVQLRARCPRLQPSRNYRVDLLDPSDPLLRVYVGARGRLFHPPFGPGGAWRVDSGPLGLMGEDHVNQAIRSIVSRSWHFQTSQGAAASDRALPDGASGCTTIPLTHRVVL